MSTMSQALGVPIPEPHVDTWNESMGMVTDALNTIDAFAGDTATIESSPSTAAHSIGEFLLYDGRLYKVTAPIAVGASLALGTNVEAAKVGPYLTELSGEVDSIEASIAPVESTTATGNHAVGDLFMLGDVLKRVTSAISTGETITGSNSVDTTVAEYLKPTPITVTPAANASINKSDCFTACGVAFIALVIRATANIGVDPDYPGYVTLATVNKLPATNVVAMGAYWNGSAYEMTDTPIRAADGKVQIYRPSGVNSTRLAYVNMFYKYV